jgi:tetratricopeptide (TPR) repeat protein
MEANWKGLYHLNRLSRKDNQEARRLFERAIELEPGVGWSYAFLGNTYLLELANGWSSDSGLVERAEELGRRAVEVDGSLPAGHVTLAGVHIYRERPEAAVIEAERGIELAPNDAGAHAIRGVALAQAGRFLEASRSIKRALRLNPQPDSLLLMFTAYVNYGAARKEQAIELMERVRTATPENVTIRTMLAVLYEQAGRHADAQTAIREGLAVRPDLTAEQALALIPGFETLVGPEEFAEAPGLLRTAGLP